MGYGAMVTLRGAMGYGAMVLHDAENCNKVMASCNHGVLTYGAMEYNHGALRLGAVQKGQIVKFYRSSLFYVQVLEKDQFKSL
jgi:hypothetical protein